MIHLAFAAALAPQWNAWKYVRAIAPAPRSGSVSVIVPPSLYANAQPSLADLRVLSGTAAAPFAIMTPPPADTVSWEDTSLSDAGFVPGRYSQIVVDRGANEATYTVVELATTQSRFATKATVDASDDRETWRVVRTDAPIYDYAQDGLATNLRILIPPTTARYLRIRVASGKPFAITAVRIAASAGTPRELTRYGVEVHGAAAPEKRESAYELSGIDQVPIERLEIDSTTPAFARDAELQEDLGGGWVSVAHTRLYRTPSRRGHAFTFDETQAPRWRVLVHDGDDAPLRGVVVQAFGAPRVVMFDTARQAPHALIYGNPRAAAPDYDYAATHANALHSAAALALGATEINTAYVKPGDTRPWTERNGWILWIALAIAAFAIGAVSLRSLR